MEDGFALFPWIASPPAFSYISHPTSHALHGSMYQEKTSHNEPESGGRAVGWAAQNPPQTPPPHAPGPFGRLGAPVADFGLPLAPFGYPWAPFGRPLGSLWLSWATLWLPLGCPRAPFGHPLGSLWPLWSPRGRPFGALFGCFGLGR